MDWFSQSTYIWFYELIFAKYWYLILWTDFRKVLLSNFMGWFSQSTYIWFYGLIFAKYWYLILWTDFRKVLISNFMDWFSQSTYIWFYGLIFAKYWYLILWTDFRKVLTSKFIKIRPVRSELFHAEGGSSNGRTDMTKLIVTFFAILRTHLKIAVSRNVSRVKTCSLFPRRQTVHRLA